MRTQKRVIAKRMLSFFFVILLLVSTMVVGVTPASAADLGDNSISDVGAGGTSGDASLFTEADSTTPYVRAEKSSYKIDTPVIVTAGNGARLGLYKSSVTAPTSSDAAIYTYNLSGKEGVAIDIRTGTYNTSSGVMPYLQEGTYNLFLFTTTSGYTVAAQTQIKITNGNVDTIDGTNTYVETNRAVYRYGEQILIKAKTASYANSWVGLYEKQTDVAVEKLPVTIAPDYIVNVGKSGIANVDLIANSSVNKNMELAQGSDYYLLLMSDKNPVTATVLGYVSVQVRGGVVRSEKTSYGYGEDIIAHVDDYATSDASINNQLVVAGTASGSYASGTSPSVSMTNKSNLLLSYFYSSATTTTQTTYIVSGDKVTLLKTSGGSTYNRINAKFNSTYANHWYWPNMNPVSGSDVKISGTLKSAAYLYSAGSNSAPGSSTAKVVDYQFPAGTPYNYIEYYNIIYSKVQIGNYVGYIYHNRWSNSYINQTAELHSSVTAWDANKHASFRTYDADVAVADSTQIGSYKLTDNLDAPVVLQDKFGKTFDVGNYKMYAMRNSGTSSYTNRSMNVSAKVTGKFGSGAYQVDNLDDGFANGRVAFEIDAASSFGYVGNEDTYAIVYWAGEDKNPLEGYSAFCRVPIEQNIVTFDMKPYSIIPEGAAGLVAYVQYRDVQGTTGCYISLPEGCKAYTGLDSGSYTEFQVLADTKLGHTSATQYPNNDNHYKTALVDIAKNSPSSQFVFINGDVTAGGTDAQWALPESLRTEAASAAGATVPPLYISRGNVDDGSGQTGYINFVNSHGGQVSTDKLYYSFEKNGYKYIVLCDDNGDRNLSATQLSWLDRELADNKERNGDQPVFIFCHYALVGGALGDYSTDRNENTAEVSAVLKKYDNIYMFSGNHRANLGSDNNIMGGTQSIPVSINVGATSGTGIIKDSKLISFDAYKDSNHPNYDENSNQGVYVRVYEDKVVILGRDFNTGTYVPEACCVLKKQDVTAYENITMEFGRTLSANSYVTDNPNNATLYGGFSTNTNIIEVADNGAITVANKGEGTATAILTAKATDTNVIKRLNTDVRVVKVKDTNYYIKGSFDNWGEGFMLRPSADNADILTATGKLSEGSYEIKVNSFDDWFGASATINDATTEAIVMDGTDNTTLVATGGTYVFTYNKSTKELTVTHKPFTQDETDANALFELADTTEPYLYASSDTYILGRGIYLTAQGGSWIGVYTADTEIGGTLSYNISMSNIKAGEAFDLRTQALVGNDASRDPVRCFGTYKAVLFGSEGTDDVLETVYFEVKPLNDKAVDGDNYLATNKGRYYKGEKIFITAYTDTTTAGAWVAVVPHGQPVNDSTILYKYTLPVIGEGDDAYFDTSPKSLIEYSNLNKNVAIDPGQYDLYLYRSSSLVYPKGVVNFEVTDSGGTISSNWSTYGRGEDIVTSVYSNNSSTYVRMYRGDLGSTLPADDTNLVAWYHVYSQDSFAVNLQDIDPTKASGQYIQGNTGDPLTLDEATPGTYTIYLVNGTNVFDSIKVNIGEGGSGSVLKGAYQVENLTDGYANGRVAVMLDENALGYVGSGYVTLRWADAQGNPLEGYTAFTEKRLTKTITTFELNPYTFIPEGAVGFLATISYNGIPSNSEDATCFIRLPEGCLPYDVDSGVTSEFQIIADPQLEDEAAAYDTIGSVTEALTDIALNSANSAGIFVAGDMTYGHSSDEFDIANTIIANVEQETGKTLPGFFASMGDSDDGFSDYYNSAEPFMNFVNYQLQRAGIDKTIDKSYYSLMIGGYKFIFMSCDAGDNLVSAEQIQWLDEELQDNEANNGGKPVFIISHQKLENTDHTTYHVPITNTAEIAAVTQKYDGVLYFSGHSLYSLHSDFASQGGVGIFPGNEELPVTVHAGGVGFSHELLADGTETSYSNNHNTGYYVRTYEDRVVLMARDFKTGEWIPDASYIIYNDDIKHDEVFEAVVDEYYSVDDYIENPYGREITFTTSDPTIASVDAEGNLKAGIPGEATITYFVKATNKAVIKRGEITIDVRGEGYPSKYSIAHLLDWDNPVPLIFTADKDVVTATVELTPDSYYYAVRLGDDYFGTTAPLVDFTTETLVLDGYDFVSLTTTGGYYTFTYRISTKELDIEYKPLDLTETGEKTATIYVDYEDSEFTSTPYIYIWDENKESVNKNIGPLAPGQLLSGPNSEGYYYRTFKYDTSYQFVISDGATVKTADSIVYDQEEAYVYFTSGTDYVTEKDPWFWVDLTPNDPSDPIDRLYPELVGMDGNYPLYCLYLPAGVDAKKIRLYGDEGANMKVSFVPVTVDGTKTVNLSGGVNKTTKYNITDASNKTFAKLTVKQTAEIPAMYIWSDMIMPIGTGYEAAHKDGYSSAGTIKMIDSTSTVLYDGLEFTDLSIKAGDTPSTDIIGKYSYDLTLKDDTALTAGGGKTYSLVSYDADEARLRNMTAIELANAMGLKDAVSCQPVEVYNNGVYMGAYLLVERVETEALTLEFTTGNENSFTSLMGQPITCITEGVTASQMTELEEKWAEAEVVIYDPAATYEDLASVIDVESFAKVYLLQELTKGINAGADNYYVYYENGKFTAAFTPEYDNTLGQMLPEELTDPEGWWARTKEIEGEGIPNAQAALCENPVFWNVVKAEWIEIFYDAASAMVPTEATYNTTTKAVTGVSGTYKEYYTQMAKSAAMDDAKWGICTKDALENEQVNDSGNIYEISFAFLNNFVYNRLNWMDEELGQGYTLAQPTLTTKKPVFAVNEEIELKAEITSSGNLKYEFYNSAGELVHEETTDKGYVIYKTTYTDEMVETYKVVITSPRAESPVEAETTVTVEYFDFILDVEAPKKVVGGSLIELKASTNVEAEVEFTLTDKEGNFLNASTDGVFEIITSTDDEAGLLEYVIKADTTVDGITYTTSQNVVVELIKFELSVDLTGPEKVEAGLDINLIAKAQVNDDVAIKYTFYNAEDLTLLGSNYTGAYIFSTDNLEAGAFIKFYVEVECEAYGNVYTAKSDVLTVEVESITDVFNVTIYFKSTSTYGYKPLITTEGAVKDFTNEEMTKDIFICKNETETASYFWYKTEIAVSRKSPTAFIRILSSRYAMEVQTNLLINEHTTYYFATDNLNDGTVLYDLTHASEDERNWCQSAVHMVYDPKVDSEESLAQVSARVDLRFVGDTTADGKVNIRDATYIQKGLAGIIKMNATDLEVADIDDDMKVSIKDATHIQKKLAGIVKNSYDIGGILNETH